MIFLCALLLGAPALGGTFPARGAALFDTELVAGDYWGLPITEAAKRLGAGASTDVPGIGSGWFIESALEKIWGVKTASGLARVEVSSSAWLLSSGGRTFGYMAKVPVDDQESYGILARRRFSRSEIIHLEAAPPPGISDLAHFIHCVRWTGAKTNFVLLTATPKRRARAWRDPQTGTLMRVEILHKAKDPNVPLYLIFWDSRRPS
jgi:hypothetical protein